TAVYSPTNTQTPISSPTVTATIIAATPAFTPTRLPPQVVLPEPEFEPQDWNNCGPVALSMYLNFYGWEGDQYAISDLVKPVRSDRNVNIDELVNYVYQNVWWLNAKFRVGGNIDLIRKVISAGMPILIEESMYLEEQFWFNDDRWAGHYLLVTGYDDVRQVFIAQDSFIGANREVSYAELDQNWRAFNRVYLLVYLPEQDNLVQELLGGDNDIDINRQNALQEARREIESEPDDPIAWFNLGSNLVYFERYNEAAEAYDIARSNELPQRMLRYQFGPFLAYFHDNRIDDLLALTEYAITVTPNSEEALLWQGWAYYRLGRKSQALDSFLDALEPHPGYADAEYAINFVQNN
ncbi:MAG: C39 family peptidase, partial [Anaerolineaceae bacterium]|nr:C39 family peptidase [Anaerolineaceae bacterium]